MMLLPMPWCMLIIAFSSIEQSSELVSYSVATSNISYIIIYACPFFKTFQTPVLLS
jgi:hypothetical protein